MFRQLTKTLIRKSFEKTTCRGYIASKKIPDLTKDRYHVDRGVFAEVNNSDIAFFASVIGSDHLITDLSEAQGYNVDFLGSVRGYGRIVVRPKTTEEVSAIVKYCNERKLAICPQGGNTGLVGGSVPVFDEIILSTQRMNKIEKIDDLSGILICQSGCILEHLEEKVSERGLVMPLDLGAKGQCHIGGNVSTNAGGLRLLRYGNLHGSVLGVEVVKADGTVLNLMSNFKKDNTGYHLKHLFIGSEGTLGIVTKVAIHCPTASKAFNVAFLGLESYESVLKTFLAAKHDLGEILSSCEMIDYASLESSTNVFGLQSPLDKYPFYMLIETSGSHAEHDEEKVNKFLEKLVESGIVLDGTVTSEPNKIKKIWQLRERVPDSLIQNCYCFKYDISLPLSNFYEIVPVMKERCGNLATNVTGYGHIGDANLHLNITCDEFTEEIYNCVQPYVYEYVAKLNGSISAEHGIGFLKTKYLKYSKEPEALLLMKQIKTMIDPNGILNPYKVLPDIIELKK